MRKLWKLLGSKFFLFSLMIVLQLAVMYLAIFYFSEQEEYFILIAGFLSFIVAAYIINTPILPEYKIAWLVPVLLLPAFGIPLYIILGKRRFHIRNDVFPEATENYPELLAQNKDVLQRSKSEDYFVNQMANYIYFSGKGRVNYGDEVAYYPNGETMFAALIEDLKKARKYIFLEFFILKPGKVLDTIMEILGDKVKEGVEVFLLYDDLGCTFNLPGKYIRRLVKLGVKTRGFQPFRPFLNSSINNRNHRKTVVIDGKIAYTGGINLADEYINAINRFGYWKDAGARFVGRSVDDVVISFLQMWNDTIRKKDDKVRDIEKYVYRDYRPLKGAAYTIFAHDDPYNDDSVSESAYLKIIDQAERYVYITTPYLVIDHNMKRSLTLAAQSGVDVRIIIPGVPDKKVTYQLTKSFVAGLLKGGVKVYFYKPGFIHAKSFVSDDRYAMVGTANLDYRSLYLHYECSLFVADKQFSYSVKEDYLRTLEDCVLATNELLHTNIFTRIWRALLRMLAPLF